MTDQERKAMEMALPLLVAYQDYTGDSRIANKCGEAIEALRQALAQPEQQWGDSEISKPEVVEAQKRANNAVRALVDACDEHVAKVVFQQPEQEPVAYIFDGDLNWCENISAEDAAKMHKIPLYTAPPKQWVGLTDEERETIVINSYSKYDAGDPEFVAAEVEAKLKERNT